MNEYVEKRLETFVNNWRLSPQAKQELEELVEEACDLSFESGQNNVWESLD